MMVILGARFKYATNQPRDKGLLSLTVEKARTLPTGMFAATIGEKNEKRSANSLMKQNSLLGTGISIFDFSRLAHNLADNLSQTRALKRGRGAYNSQLL